ncbi:glycerol-3-phosphate dehydrogenase/oxidase [Ramlibacter tataouinensis]|uniref:Aerobic glycerol-3-phosphate dehydrogenase-like protein n=1 Tax=Ramlibacter tataouinensis (strain ATCC BAA-407 / DSM 14655 / LMG 21543 / TTB310) TaxID=365046 RepID=F5Y1F3_RAMTT|nr:glycerol-3-phosphate dehydrogenase/oxidase [Ramlibacter tataouinensis]AEG94737.1 aerobic glycerol-3-phosphate dehydrogenase-like protein [Ramlibacter tataouinensis TTB310]
MQRQQLLAELARPKKYDLAIIGGGATGLGVALDAAARGFSAVLIESHDFASGTSSRATKMVHGGVRYLAQGNVSLVREALHERGTLLRNAPHLAQPLPFVMPSYRLWETPFYGAGLKLYDVLAGRAGLGSTEFLGRGETLGLLPTLRPEGLKGGVKYWDGQFDDARLALALARTAAARGALLVNYCEAAGLVYEDGKVAGLRCRDRESGREFPLAARCVINAAGVWVDELRRQDGEATGRAARPMVAPSQGVHLVVDRDFLPGDHALMVPKTADGRVLFGVPWLGKLILGTTDTPRDDLAREPTPFGHELDFILGEAGRYLRRAPRREDVRSIWVGLRPLVKPQGDDGEDTKSLSREHTVLVSRSGLVTVTGGKWTTYRAMAEDVLERCFAERLLDRAVAGVTADLPLVGADVAPAACRPLSAPPGLHLYGSEADEVAALPGARHELGGGLSEAMVRFAARREYARTVEDVLARRQRLLFLDAGLAASLAPAVGELLRQETGADPQVQAFERVAQAYQGLPNPGV